MYQSVLFLLIAIPTLVVAAGYTDSRRSMLRAMRSLGVTNRAVLQAMREVPRHHFVPAHLRSHAYEDRPLPIGHGQTISQPALVAYMNQLLEPDKSDTLLEVGTGSGYHAATVSRLVARVYSVEIIKPLALQAGARHRRLGYRNIRVRHGNGYYGWAKHGPFDKILVTAAADHVPPPLLKQLKKGGRMVIPVGSPFSYQNLVLIHKTRQGRIISRNIIPVRFVPLTGGKSGTPR